MKKKTKQWLKEIEKSMKSLGKRMKAIEKMVHDGLTDKRETHEQQEEPSSMGRRRARENKRNKLPNISKIKTRQRST